MSGASYARKYPERAKAMNHRYWEKNKERIRKYQRDWARAHGTQVYFHRLKRKHGVTRKEYEAQERKQHKRCAICGIRPNYKLHVDHDHRTNKLRGLLCFPCNSGLGNFRDDAATLEAAIRYLRGPSWAEVKAL